MSIAIQIGNSDDKLEQREWAAFVASVQGAVEQAASEIHFVGASGATAPWQNAAWIFECDGRAVAVLRERLKEMREHWRQDSIAWTEGETRFI